MQKGAGSTAAPPDLCCSKSIAKTTVGTREAFSLQCKRGRSTGHFYRDSFPSLRTLDDTDKDALAFVQMPEARPLERGGMHKDVLPATIPNNEAETLGGVVPLTVPISGAQPKEDT